MSATATADTHPVTIRCRARTRLAGGGPPCFARRVTGPGSRRSPRSSTGSLHSSGVASKRTATPQRRAPTGGIGISGASASTTSGRPGDHADRDRDQRPGHRRHLTADDLDEWLEHKATELATSTMQEVLSILRRSITLAQRRDLVARNVADLVTTARCAGVFHAGGSICSVMSRSR